jgi:tetratricopeptide (TPR) repeat protein
MKGKLQRLLTLAAFALFPPLCGCGPGTPDPQQVAAEAGRLLDEGEVQKAIDMLQAAEERNSGNPVLAEQLAFAWAQKGDRKTAAFYFNRLAELSPDRSDALLFAAQNLEQAGDAEGALVTYQQYLAKTPGDAAALAALAGLAEKGGRTDLAIESYEKLYAVQPSGGVATALGNLYLKKNDDAKASEWFNKALSAHHGSEGEARLGLLGIALESKNAAQAEGLIADLKKENPGLLEGSALKDAPATVSKWKAAQAPAKKPAPAPVAATPAPAPAPQAPVIDIRRADGTTVEPGTAAVPPPAERARPMSKAEAVAAELALEDAAEKAATTPPPAPVAAPLKKPLPLVAAPAPAPVPPELAKARAAAQGDNLDEAIRLYRNYLAKNTQDALAWNEFSALSMKAGATGQALAASLEATRVDPYNLDYALQYLVVVEKVYDPRRAMNEVVAMKRRFPDSPVITLALARAYWEVEGNAVLSRAMYDEYLSRAPKGSDVSAVKAERDALPAGF